MLMLNRTHPYGTLRQDAQVETLLNSALEAISVELQALHVKHPALYAVWLGGGYGRGEGGVHYSDTHAPRLYNDLDLFVFTKSCCSRQRKQLDYALAQLATIWAERLHIEVDFAPAKEISHLPRYSQMLMYQELARGHVVLFGASQLPLPLLDPETLPISEALRLLLNRGTGLLLAACEMNRTQPNADFIMRNQMKVALGIGDAMLIAQHAYQWSLKARVLAVPASSQAIYLQAVTYKEAPTLNDQALTWERFHTLQTHWQTAFNTCLGGSSLASHFGKASTRNILRVLIKRKRLNLTGVSPLALTLARLQPILQRDLSCITENDPIIVDYLTDWRIFN